VALKGGWEKGWVSGGRDIGVDEFYGPSVCWGGISVVVEGARVRDCGGWDYVQLVQ
jgi:hypothetical protein